MHSATIQIHSFGSRVISINQVGSFRLDKGTTTKDAMAYTIITRTRERWVTCYILYRDTRPVRTVFARSAFGQANHADFGCDEPASSPLATALNACSSARSLVA